MKKCRRRVYFTLSSASTTRCLQTPRRWQAGLGRFARFAIGDHGVPEILELLQIGLGRVTVGPTAGAADARGGSPSVSAAAVAATTPAAAAARRVRSARRPSGGGGGGGEADALPSAPIACKGARGGTPRAAGAKIGWREGDDRRGRRVASGRKRLPALPTPTVGTNAIAPGEGQV